MKISQERYNELQNKKKFVADISKVFVKQTRYTSVEDIKYDVIVTDNYIEEFVVVTYFGGAIAAARSTGNSLTAIFRTIGGLLDGGNYDGNQYYTYLKEAGKELTEDFVA